jgi:hypothetical protein
MGESMNFSDVLLLSIEAICSRFVTLQPASSESHPPSDSAPSAEAAGQPTHRLTPVEMLETLVELRQKVQQAVDSGELNGVTATIEKFTEMLKALTSKLPTEIYQALRKNLIEAVEINYPKEVDGYKERIAQISDQDDLIGVIQAMIGIIAVQEVTDKTSEKSALLNKLIAFSDDSKREIDTQHIPIRSYLREQLEKQAQNEGSSFINLYKEYQQKYGRSDCIENEIKKYLPNRLTNYTVARLRQLGISPSQMAIQHFNEPSYERYSSTANAFVRFSPEFKNFRDELENWLLFDDRETDDSERQIKRWILPNEEASKLVNKKLHEQLKAAKAELEGSFGYKIRKFFNFLGKKEEDIIGILNKQIENFKENPKEPKNKERYLQSLVALSRDMKDIFRNDPELRHRNSPTLQRLYKIQLTIYSYLQNSSRVVLTPGESRYISFYKHYAFFEDDLKHLDVLLKEMPFNPFVRLKEKLFDSASGKERKRLIEGIRDKLKTLTEINTTQQTLEPSNDFRNNFILYLESLRNVIVNSKDPELKAQLRKLLREAVNRIVLEKNGKDESNYQVQFSNDQISELIYPICKKVGLDTEILSEIVSLICKGKNKNNEQLMGYVSCYDEAQNKEDFIRERCYPSSFSLEKPAIKLKIRETKKQIETENKILKACENGQLQDFHKAVAHIVRDSIFASFSIQSGQVQSKPHNQKEVGGQMIQKVADLIASVPEVGETLKKVMGTVGDLITKRGAQESHATHVAIDSHVDQVSDIDEISEYLARKVTQMLEYCVVEEFDEKEITKIAGLVVQRMFAALAKPEFRSSFNEKFFGTALCEALLLNDDKQGHFNLREVSLARKSDNGGIVNSGDWTFEGVLRRSGYITEEVGPSGKVTRHYYKGESSELGKYGFIRVTPELVKARRHYEEIKSEELEALLPKIGVNNYKFKLPFSGLEQPETMSESEMHEKAITELKNNLAEQKEKNSELEERLKRVEVMLGHAQQVAPTQAIVAGLEQPAQQGESNAELKNTVIQQKKQIALLTNTVGQHARKIGQLGGQIGQLVQQNTALLEEIRQLVQQNTALLEEIRQQRKLLGQEALQNNQQPPQSSLKTGGAAFFNSTQ